MSKFKEITRLAYIVFVFLKFRLDRLLFQLPIPVVIRLILYLNPLNWLTSESIHRGRQLRLALESLGPIFVKFGQILSTRRDLLPDDIAYELALLQDRVPPFGQAYVQQALTKAYGDQLYEIFETIEMTPLASASVAQVHKATLKTGEQVVIKILRPNISKVIRRDVNLMYAMARVLGWFWSEASRLKPMEVVAEFEQHIFDELDLVREAANASQLRRNFLDSADLYVPEVFWAYTQTNIMVLERIQGISIADIEGLRQAGINLKRLAEVGVEIFFTQVFRDCFFHADMHPGNIFVSPDHPEQPQYIAVDFGIMGTLTPTDQHYLAENFLAFFKRDYRRVAELHVESGWVPAETRINDLESAVRAVCEPIFERPLKDISCGQLLLRLFQTAGRFNMEIQPQLLLLQKTLLNVEGLGKQLYPDLNLWLTAKPFLEDWLRQQVGPRAFVKKVREYAPFWAEKFPEIPDLVYKYLQTRVAPRAYEKPIVVTRVYSSGKGFLLGFAFALFCGALAGVSLDRGLLPQLTHQQIAALLVGVLGLFYFFHRRKRIMNGHYPR